MCGAFAAPAAAASRAHPATKAQIRPNAGLRRYACGGAVRAWGSRSGGLVVVEDRSRTLAPWELRPRRALGHARSGGHCSDTLAGPPAWFAGRARHCTARLPRILSDSKPSDLDRYQSCRGIEDTTQAIQKARRQGLEPFCVTIDREGNDYLPHLFSSGGYLVVRRPADRPSCLPLLHAGFTA